MGERVCGYLNYYPLFLWCFLSLFIVTDTTTNQWCLFNLRLNVFSNFRLNFVGLILTSVRSSIICPLPTTHIRSDHCADYTIWLNKRKIFFFFFFFFNISHSLVIFFKNTHTHISPLSILFDSAKKKRINNLTWVLFISWKKEAKTHT